MTIMQFHQQKDLKELFEECTGGPINRRQLFLVARVVQAMVPLITPAQVEEMIGLTTDDTSQFRYPYKIDTHKLHMNQFRLGDISKYMASEDDANIQNLSKLDSAKYFKRKRF